MFFSIRLLFLLFFPFLEKAEAYIPEYVWNLGFAIAADQTPFTLGLPKNYGTTSHGYFVDPGRYIRSTKNGSIIWIQRAQLSRFYQNVLPHLRSRFVLVINDGDLSFPSCRYDSFNTQYLIHDSRVICIFAQNVDGSFPHPKICHLPIGLDYHSMVREGGFFGEKQCSVQEQEAILKEILSTLSPTHERKKRVLIDFGHNDCKTNGESRTDILSRLSSLPFVDQISVLPRHTLWKLKGAYAFSVSAHGYGLDCHRTWEGLLLGNIVLVKTSSLDAMYEGLPVVIVKEWSEITEENLDLWLKKYKDAFTNPSYREKLTHTYWMNKIRRKALEK